jgi:hypothetical protein
VVHPKRFLRCPINMEHRATMNINNHRQILRVARRRQV